VKSRAAHDGSPQSPTSSGIIVQRVFAALGTAHGHNCLTAHSPKSDVEERHRGEEVESESGASDGECGASAGSGIFLELLILGD